ncbi:hypothetical protein DYB34_004290 [Aphanomyces astaci]|uniref:Uncharacterized protein n=1 Tax=Aphanomyces astaci TaxID=112090 RepID=A0A418BU70_APHAT|nr:hypothetical protein DYB34_004290 [Aphanomyces astaci]
MHLTHYAATNEWISLGDKTITFWAEQGRNLNGKKAILGKNTPTQVFYCAIAVPTTGKPSSKLIVGAHDGSLYVLDDKHVSRVLKAHTGPAYALFASRNFDIAIPLTKLFNLLPPDASKKGGAATSSSLFGVRSVCFNSEHTRILLGTSGSDVVQFDRMGTKATVLWGLAVHPAKPEYCTVGDDKTLRVWSTEHRLQLRVKSLECVARACAYSNAAPFCIAVGFGGRIGKRKKHVKEGGVVVFSADSLEIVFEDKPSKEWISEIKFSPNNATLAVGSHDNAIYLYAIRDNRFTKVTKVFRGHNSYITHLDFSTDGKYLQSNCGAYELLFSDANTGKQVTSARSLRDVQWHTWTCALGWPVQGIWPACADGTDINAVHRCHSGELVATGDDFGQVKLFRYPAVAKHSVSYSAHHATGMVQEDATSFIRSDGHGIRVFGYQTELSRNNLRYNADGQIVYHAAAVGIVYDRDTNTQKIRVWDAKSGATLCVLTGFHARGVVSVTFSHDEKTIASVGDDDDHSLAIWEDKGGAWSNGRLMTTSKGDKNVNLFAIALPRQAFVTGGVKHILFWTLQGKTVSHVKGQFGKLATQQPLLCACSFYDQTTLTGADNGDLYHWTGHTVTKSVKAHDGSLSALFSVLQPDKSYTVVSGGKDGKVCVWNQSLQQTSSFSIDASGNLSSVRAKTIKSVALDSTFKKILVGTLSSDAFEVEVGTGVLLKTVAGGHFMGETWGLAVHPLDPTAFVTVGDDKIARVYDRQAKTSVVLMELEDMARAIAFSPRGTMLAIGYGGDVGRGKKKGGKVGAIGFYEHPSTTIVFEDHPSKAAISGYELLFCDTTTGKQMKSARALKDVVWDTWTCVLGWPVQGIWPEFADGTDVNATCASTSRTFVATGDDSSNVKVFRYPCLTKGVRIPHYECIVANFQTTSVKLSSHFAHQLDKGTAPT